MEILPETTFPTDMERQLLILLLDCGHEIDESLVQRQFQMNNIALIQDVMEQMSAEQKLGGKLCVQREIMIANVTSVFEVPAILKAIFLKDESSLREILLDSPGSANQLFANRMTPLHLAVSWPGGLSILLDGGATVSSYDRYGRTPLLYANGSEHNTSVKILSDHDSPLGDSDDPNYCLESAFRSKDISLGKYMITHLVDRRQRLLALAQQELPSKKLMQLNLNMDRVLDAQAAVVTNALLEEDIEVPPALMPSLNLQKSTVYHTDNLSVQMANDLYAAGFRDIDEIDTSMMTPFWSNALYTPCCFENLEIMQWLRNTGVNIHRLHPTNGGTASHCLGASVGEELFQMNKNHELGLQRSRPTSEQARIASSFLDDAFSDGCDCACSRSGCRVITSALKRQCGWSRSGDSNCESLRFSTSVWICKFVASGAEECHWVPFEVIRTMTFEWLELTHTCHIDPFWYNFDVLQPLSDEEVKGIQEEERFLIQQHEELVAEFEVKYIELGVSLTSFLESYWWSRIHQVLDENDKTNHEEEKKLRELGVVVEARDLGEYEEDEEEKEKGKEDDSDDDEGTGSDSEDEEYESADEELGVGIET